MRNVRLFETNFLLGETSEHILRTTNAAIFTVFDKFGQQGVNAIALLNIVLTFSIEFSSIVGHPVKTQLRSRLTFKLSN